MLAGLRSQKFREFAAQFLFAGGLMTLLVIAVLVGKHNIEQMGINSGFGFLKRSTDFDVSFALIEYDAFDSFGRLLWVGILNTMFLGAIGILLANVIGLIVALLRISSNVTFNIIGAVYIDTFRNIPMILQVMLFYAVITHLPHPREAHVLLDSIYVSGRGIYVPGLNVTGGAAALSCFVLIMTLIALVYVSFSRRFKRLASASKRLLKWGIAVCGAVLFVAILAWGRLPDTPLYSVPALKGLNLRGGIRIPPEFSALALSMGIYGGAYIAEIARAGFLSVGKGQTEAARALGLGPWHVFSRVRLPLAFRAVLPTLTNQYVWLFKATTLGIAVGFVDFFSVVSVSINQAGQTLELIGILMLGFLVMNNAMAFVLNRVNKAIALKGTQLRS